MMKECCCIRASVVFCLLHCTTADIEYKGYFNPKGAVLQVKAWRDNKTDKCVPDLTNPGKDTYCSSIVHETVKLLLIVNIENFEAPLHIRSESDAS
jgi:hypothetical protein